MDPETIKLIFGIIGTILATFFYISPAVPCYKLYKGELNHRNYPGILLACSLFNCILWFVYGIELNELMVYVANSSGAIITELWLLCYIYYYAEQNLLYGIVFNVEILLSLIGILLVFHYPIHNPDTTGKVAMIFNTLMYAAPGEKMFTVYKTNNYKILPISTSICGVLCSTSWLIYGIYLGDISMIFPNALGVVFAVLQIIVFIIAYNRAKTQGILKVDDGKGSAPLVKEDEQKEEKVDV